MEVYKSTHTSDAFNFALSAVPSIGEHRNWFIGEQDTGIFAKGINVTGAEVGQTVKVAAVDENGVPTAWEAMDLAAGTELKLVAKVTTTENSTGIEMTGLNILSPTVSIRIFNTGKSTNNGLSITVNGVKKAGHTGTLGFDGTDQARVPACLYKDSGSLFGKATMANSGVNSYEWKNFDEPITSIGVTSAGENDGETTYIQAGTIVEIYEGVFPNVQ